MEKTNNIPAENKGKAIYQQYLRKIEELKPHQEYADLVAQATSGGGTTPVKPLATMGCNGGPLLCDVCRKPMILEGGKYHGKDASTAWKMSGAEDRLRKGGRPIPQWASWILGGMVVEIQTNGTLRIYHGYEGRSETDCVDKAIKANEERRKEYVCEWSREKWNQTEAFLISEFPNLTFEEITDLTNKVMDEVFSYNPGIGVNRP